MCEEGPRWWLNLFRVQLAAHVCVLTLLVNTTASTQWFDDVSIKNTVLIEKRQDTSFVPLGTGFLVYDYSNSDFAYVVTCAHLLRRSEVYVSVNIDSSFVHFAARRHIDSLVSHSLTWSIRENRMRARVKLETQTRTTFLVDTSCDVGVFLIAPISALFRGRDTVKVFVASTIPRSGIRQKAEVKLGDELYFVGFPFGIGAGTLLEPVVRSGSVAWKSENSHEFLLDAMSFGGNSGSPIFTKVLLGRKPGELGWESPKLVGMILGHLGDKLEGLLTQPNPQSTEIIRRSMEIQNFGLARALWFDSILPLLDRGGSLQLGN